MQKDLIDVIGCLVMGHGSSDMVLFVHAGLQPGLGRRAVVKFKQTLVNTTWYSLAVGGRHAVFL